MYKLIIESIDEMLGLVPLKDQLELLEQLKSDIEVRIEGVEDQLSDEN